MRLTTATYPGIDDPEAYRKMLERYLETIKPYYDKLVELIENDSRPHYERYPKDWVFVMTLEMEALKAKIAEVHDHIFKKQ